MKNIVLLTVVVTLLLPALAYGLTAKEKLDDAMGRAYKAATEKNLDQAQEWFLKASSYANEDQNWQGFLDAGYGLSTLGDTAIAKECFDKAGEIIDSQKDWHGAVALGYAYASLPDDLKTIPLAEKMFNSAKSWAQEKGDVFGLIEAGRGLMSINKNTAAEECLDLAADIVKEAPTQNAVKIIVEAYRKLGKEDKAEKCTAYLAQATQPGSPPPGWQPTAGETVRSPKTVSPGIQQAQRSSADQDISAQQSWEQQRAEEKAAARMQRQQLAYQAYSDYLRYYSYPYYGVYSGLIVNDDDYYYFSWGYRPRWCARTYPEVYNWALWNLGRYTCVDGIYIAVDID